MLPVVLVHGGGLDHRCWERLQAHLTGPVLAVDHCPVVDLDAGHMAMVSQAAPLAELIDRVAGEAAG